MTYKEFLERKIDIAPMSGIEVNSEEVNPVLKNHQKVSVLWALRGGRRGIFARFGLDEKKGDDMSKDDMGRNAEHYADPTPAAAMKNIRKDERQKDAATLLQISILVPLLRQVADLAGFEILGRIPLRDKATGKEWR